MVDGWIDSVAMWEPGRGRGKSGLWRGGERREGERGRERERERERGKRERERERERKRERERERVIEKTITSALTCV